MPESFQEAENVADRILTAFVGYSAQFAAITRGAAARFEARAWGEVQTAARDRILLYRAAKHALSTELKELAGLDWRQIRQAYEKRLADRPDGDIAGTFFNGVYRRVTYDEQIGDDVAFVSADPLVTLEPHSTPLITISGSDISILLKRLLEETELAAAMRDIDHESNRVAERLRSDIPLLRASANATLEMLRPVFYRNKGAYLVGTVTIDEHVIPLALALRHPPGGVIVDAVLWSENHLSTIFSFTRAYFMVDVESPSALVTYLQALLPEKKRSELFSAIGFYKHGKTEFVRGYRQHLAQSDDQFRIAEGIRGQVMMVFSLASYQTVFKIIKDKFPTTKSVTRDDVMAAYQLVKTHDRVGRMADTQEFYRFTFPRERFDETLLEELQKVAGDSVKVTDESVVIRHLYCERLMTPLNIYMNQCSEFQLQQVLLDYGNAIKELAAANIFPGDMLLKNFGVTRHGRVVFYDYDEICYLTDVNFRDMPMSEQGSVTGEAWFDVGEFDVFPEEFSTFLFPDDWMQQVFKTSHADLFTATGWKVIQIQVSQGQLMDVFPYPARDRLDRNT